ncbi:hypothetical protein GCM10010468_03770 [Actinocorallia longicatena]|uniref:Uncharacterized protein n=1 Tax=Actinocorallia longicatena TaxID=111803 RepID=A0ABP6Q2C9_9ACTN
MIREAGSNDAPIRKPDAVNGMYRISGRSQNRNRNVNARAGNPIPCLLSTTTSIAPLPPSKH